MSERQNAEVIIIGAGIAGLSAAIYLGRAERDALVIDSGKSMARWEPDVENYLGFPEGIAGEELLKRGREQALSFDVRFLKDEISKAGMRRNLFVLEGKAGSYASKRLLIATGIHHLPPEIEGVSDCLGHSMFFCKDCDGLRAHGKKIAVYGRSNETVEYALGMLYYSSCVIIVTNGKRARWDRQHADWIEEYKIPVYLKHVVGVRREGCQLRALNYEDGMELEVDVLFTTRGDLYFNRLAKGLGATVDEDGQVIVDACLRTSVKGLYAAGCVTPANCQIIVAAGQGAAAAQAINRDLFMESLATHSLRHFRSRQLQDLKETGFSKDRKALSEPCAGTGRGRPEVRALKT
ncbi:MAG: putative Thioredoxin-disulfide reductase [Pedosphaera sp.]|nr:putative Thioredoxin-disulfide reductase [Pedosphaera sp.]